MLPSAGMAELNGGVQTPFTHLCCLWWDSPVPWSSKWDFSLLKSRIYIGFVTMAGRISFNWVTITLQTAPILLLFLWTLNLSFAKIFPQIWDVFCWVRSLSREPCQLSLCWEQMLPQGLWVLLLLAHTQIYCPCSTQVWRGIERVTHVLDNVFLHPDF